jgi:hypothetical protein
MIITLKGANFAKSNIGTLSTYSIRFSGAGVTNSNTSVDRESNTGYTTTITLGTGYELNGSITVTMGGTDITSTAVNGLTITIPTKVTGNVVITVPTKNTAGGGDPENPGSGEVVEPDTPTSNYTLIHGNKYSSGFEDNTARASISPLTIVVPTGVTITNKSTIKWAYYTGVNTNNMPSGSGSGTWGDYKYTGTGAAIGISFKKADDSAFDWSVDSTNPADYFDVSDKGLWNGTAQGTTPEPEEPEQPESAEGTLDINAFNAMTLAFGNPYGSLEQQSDPARVHSEVNLYAPAGTVISLKDNTNYKWALKKVTGATGNAADSTFNKGGYVPDSAWSAKKSYTTTVNGYWKFVLLKVSNAAFDWSTDSQKVSDYFTVS